MKKTGSIAVSLLLTASLLLSACADNITNKGPDTGKTNGNAAKVEGFNKEGLPIVNDKITLSIVSPKAQLAPEYNEMEIFKRLETDTNVHIEWTNIPDTDYAEKKNLLLASGDLPDAFYSSQFTDYELITYGKDGTIIPLEDLIDQYAPNLKKLLEERPDLKAAITAPDGHIYGLPTWEENELGTNPFFHVINTEWLNKLGLKFPETLDEYTAALLAFKTQDPNGNGKADEIPLSFMHMQWCMDIAGLFGAFGLPDNLEHRIVRDGKVIFTATQPEYKEALKYFNEKWYKQGLIDPESFTQDAPQYLAKGKTPDATLGSYVWWEIEEVVGTEQAKNYALVPPLTGPTGKKSIGRGNGGGPGRNAFVITSENENPEVTMRWIDQQYEPYMAAQIHWGPIGVIYEKDASGKLVNLPLEEGVSMGEFRQKVAPNGAGVITKEHFKTIVDMEPRAQQRKKDLEQYYEPFMEKENYPTIFFLPEELDTINQFEPELIKYVNTQRAKFIVDGVTDAEWDSYVKTVEDMGLSKLMEIYQTALDRYKEAQK
ncbi:ABC transporter substrate-binding protein [Paenibacillus prosopidis]|uniref:Carbohydrate ABC transporter substrate-binding protein (CUT1 family) n=1 Tax=Paenibacillus prosopidis TaxID=630520 RepID=A0A368VVY8_9BACL|nr:ABC transporter substrate-binding protein [Paenibacillus prosopidis]RCW45417.1 carbohydrate ABC transporter substrate-binding protein (CUT1 family) [Paenibacillus prosopidis]